MTRGNKDGWGIYGRGRPLAWLTLIIPNNKARHRSKGNGIVWRYELHYYQNMYYVKARPRLRKVLRKLKLRK